MSIRSRRRRRFRIAIGLLACSAAFLAAVIRNGDPTILAVSGPLLAISFVSAGKAVWRTRDFSKTPNQYFEVILRTLRSKETDQLLLASTVVLLLVAAGSCAPF